MIVIIGRDLVIFVHIQLHIALAFVFRTHFCANNVLGTTE